MNEYNLERRGAHGCQDTTIRCVVDSDIGYPLRSCPSCDKLKAPKHDSIKSSCLSCTAKSFPVLSVHACAVLSPELDAKSMHSS
jgi:hypothetical protein